MDKLITMTKQWQVYIPEKARKILALERPGRMRLLARKGRLVLLPQASRVLKLAGRYRGLFLRRKINLDKVRERIDYSNL